MMEFKKEHQECQAGNLQLILVNRPRLAFKVSSIPFEVVFHIKFCVLVSSGLPTLTERSLHSHTLHETYVTHASEVVE